jgi:hypothetical protein
MIVRWRDPCATPRPRTFPDESTKRFIEVRLIRQSAFNCDLRERRAGLQHQALRTLDSSPHHVRVRRFVEALPKSAAEMEHAQLNQPCEVRRADGQIQVRLDKRRHFAILPRCKTSTRSGRRSGFRATSVQPRGRARRLKDQQRNGARHVTVCFLWVVPEGAANRTQKVRHCSSKLVQ